MKIVGFKIFNITLLSVGLLVLMTGCSSKDIKTKRSDILTKPYELKITPIVGSRQDDTKVIMNMGKILKVWIAPYKNSDTFVSSHDNYVVAKAPDFVLGETVPQRNWKSVKSPKHAIPFLFRSADLDNKTNIGKEEIVKYNNNVYKLANDSKVAEKKVTDADKYDSAIKSFLAK